MDPGDRPGTHPPPIGREPGAVNSATLPEALELHATKTFATGDATFPGGDKALAGGDISKDRPPGEAGESSDLLGDETGISNRDQIGRSYASKGQTPVVRLTAKKISTSMISAVNNQGLMRFTCCKGALNASLFIVFSRRLIKAAAKKVFLIVDNPRLHHAVKVSEWVEANKDEIELFFLPAYAPERNPDEYLNNDLKQQMKNLPRPNSQEELVQTTTTALRSLQRRPDRVASYFRPKDVRYAA
jgi:hypothetical protein